MTKKKTPLPIEFPKLSAQETFNKVTTHLLAQGVSSMSSVAAAGRYRSEDGKKCAVGCLIPDQIYSPSMEKCGSDLKALSGFPGMSNLLDQQTLLRELQKLHDLNATDFFSEKKPQMRQIARKFNLSIPENIAK